MYVQNARPDGPAAWMVAEVSDRLLRWVGLMALKGVIVLLGLF